MNYEYLGLEESFQGTCSVHAFSKACQYSTIEEKVCKNLKYVSLNLLKQILKSASLGLKNIGRENNNGIRLVLKLEFG
jgi:hypothetical protein